SMKGMRVVITADLAIENVENSYRNAGITSGNVVVTDELKKSQEAIERNQVIATKDSKLVTALPEVDVVVDATGVPNIGAEIAWDSILNNKHIVMLNVEADVTIGPLLKKMADSSGVVYTGSAGDEPGAIMELFDFADAMGFEIVALGKGKNNPLDLESNPDVTAEEAEQKGSSPKM